MEEDHKRIVKKCVVFSIFDESVTDGLTALIRKATRKTSPMGWAKLNIWKLQFFGLIKVFASLSRLETTRYLLND